MQHINPLPSIKTIRNYFEFIRVSSFPPKLHHNKVWKTLMNFSSVAKLLPSCLYVLPPTVTTGRQKPLSSLPWVWVVVSYEKTSLNLKSPRALVMLGFHLNNHYVHIPLKKEAAHDSKEKQEHTETLLFASCCKVLLHSGALCDFAETLFNGCSSSPVSWEVFQWFLDSTSLLMWVFWLGCRLVQHSNAHCLHATARNT